MGCPGTQDRTEHQHEVMGGDGDLERCAKRHLALSGSSRGRRVWCLGWNPSAPALQHLPVAASERGSRERCGDPSKTGHPPFRTPSVAVRPKLSCFWMLTASSSLESASLRVRSPSVLPEVVPPRASFCFCLSQLSFSPLATQLCSSLGNEKASLGHGQPLANVPSRTVTKWMNPKSFKIVQLSALVCGAVGVLQPISVGLVRRMPEGSLKRDLRKPRPRYDPSES